MHFKDVVSSVPCYLSDACVVIRRHSYDRKIWEIELFLTEIIKATYWNPLKLHMYILRPTLAKIWAQTSMFQ